jgi:hypothetical protein
MHLSKRVDELGQPQLQLSREHAHARGFDIRHKDIGSGTKSDGNGSAGLAVRCVGAPLQDCTQLRELWLAGNPCSEVPFALAGTLPQVGARRSLDS